MKKLVIFLIIFWLLVPIICYGEQKKKMSDAEFYELLQSIKDLNERDKAMKEAKSIEVSELEKKIESMDRNRYAPGTRGNPFRIEKTWAGDYEIKSLIIPDNDPYAPGSPLNPIIIRGESTFKLFK
ncbi:MAG: hypothetical protein HY892_06680 [Deltaproteobacteria bacterium]|nr:hypothetical protein [Deltaproteobacteria bacterium]